jgi:hypothetical protein
MNDDALALLLPLPPSFAPILPVRAQVRDNAVVEGEKGRDGEDEREQEVAEVERLDVELS